MDRMGKILLQDSARTHYGHYRIVRELGRGGSAKVLLAEHIQLQKQVAIKMPHTQCDKKAKERLLREGRIGTLLKHPHIAHFHEYGLAENEPFLVMDYAPYGTVRSYYGQGKVLPLEAILLYVRQVSRAVQYMHNNGLMHLDIKPENMLLLRPDHLLLSDFGTVSSLRSILNGERVRAGTIRYMAPEQIQGRPCAASDQYALAVVVYEWLCGQPPFLGSTLSVLQQHMQTPLPSLQSMQSAYPQQVEDVLRKALAKDPRERFSSIRAFATALEKALREKPLLAPTTIRTSSLHAILTAISQSRIQIDKVYETEKLQSTSSPKCPAICAIFGLILLLIGSKFLLAECLVAADIALGSYLRDLPLYWLMICIGLAFLVLYLRNTQTNS